MNKTAKRYLWAVRKALHCPGRQGKQLLRQLGEDTDQYCEEHPAATKEELCRRFGMPEDVAADFAEALGESIAVNIQRRRSRIVIAAIVLLALIVGAVAARQIWIQHLFLDSYWVETITYGSDEPLKETGEIYWSVEFTSPPATEDMDP